MKAFFLVSTFVLNVNNGDIVPLYTFDMFPTNAECMVAGKETDKIATANKSIFSAFCIQMEYTLFDKGGLKEALQARSDLLTQGKLPLVLGLDANTLKSKEYTGNDAFSACMKDGYNCAYAFQKVEFVSFVKKDEGV